jgi:hypothetical protein
VVDQQGSCLGLPGLPPPPKVDRLDVAGGLTPGVSEPGNK